jgi:uncharacterized protein
MKRRYLKFVRLFYRQLRKPYFRKNRVFASISDRLTDRKLWKPCRATVSHGLAIGLFFSMLPIPGQSIVAAFFAIRARVNVPFAMLATFFSNPITTPALLLFQEGLGAFVRKILPIKNNQLIEGLSMKIPGIEYHVNVADFIFGFMLCAVLSALLAYPIVHVVSLFFPDHIPANRIHLRDRIRENMLPPKEN